MSLAFEDIRAAGLLLEIKYPGCLQESKKYDWTVAHFLSAFGTAKHVVALFKNHPQLFQVKSLNGLTPYEVALEYGNVKTANAIHNIIL
jgi:ankyrin repeat protein